MNALSAKLDLKRAETAYFSAPKGEWAEIELGNYSYLMIDGQGSPGDSPEYQAALAALYPLAYATKFFSKRELGRDYAVPPLEGLWWADDHAAFSAARREQWRWTLLLLLPHWIAPDHVELARHSKPKHDLTAVRFGRLEEGRCLHLLHLGSFADEAPVLHRLHSEVMPAKGLTFAGHHHEIYLSDPRRTAPEKLRTILRQPVRPIEITPPRN